MDKETEEVIDKILDMLKVESEEFVKQFPNSSPTLQLSTYDPSELVAIEKEYEIRIPKPYREFLEKYSPVKFQIMYTDIFGITHLRKELKDYIPKELLEGKLLPFAGSSGDYYCLYMESDGDKVYFFDHEKYEIFDIKMTFKALFQDLLDSRLELKEKNNSK